MVYAKRRYGYRRTYRRGNRTLSTRNIFNNKGARAQASQLYRLNRKVNSIYRQCKPELKIRESDKQQYSLTSYEYNDDSPANVQVDFTRPLSPGRITTISMPSIGEYDNDMTGNVINLKDATVYINASYQLVKDARLNSIPNDFSDSTFIRFVFFMTKTPSDDVLEATDLFDLQAPNAMSADLGITTTGSYPAGYRLNTTLPLLEGTASRFTVIKDIRVKVGSMSPDKQLRVKIPLSKYAKYIRNQYTLYGKCQLYIATITSSLEIKGVQDASENYIYAVPRLTVSHFAKLAYTDP